MLRNYLALCCFFMMASLASDEFYKSIRDYLISNKEVFENSKNIDSKSIDMLYKKLMNSDDLNYENVVLFINFIEKKYQDNAFRKLNDEKLFALTIELCRNKQFIRYGLEMLKYFNPQLYIQKSPQILFLFKEQDVDLLYLLPNEILELPEFMKLKQEALNKLCSIESRTNKGKLIYLVRRAKLSDVNAKKHLLLLLNQMSSDDDEAFHEYVFLIQELTSLGDYDSNIALLKQFTKNIGSPDYFAEKSIRYQILFALYRQYYDDNFFIKYQKYLLYGRNYNSTPKDSDFFSGNEMKIFFQDFQKWAKARMNYEVNLDNMDYKICSGYKFKDIHNPE